MLEGIKTQIRAAQVRAALAVNRELVLLYWQIGREILGRQKEAGWGAKVVEHLAADLRREFPKLKGLSRTNLLYVRAFAEAYEDEATVQQLVGPIPWGHNLVLLDKLGDAELRGWYARQAIEHGWSRNVLVHQIERGLHARRGQAVTDFARTLPSPQSDPARELIKDPYHFDFLALGPKAQERDLERALVTRLRDFLLELGVGFAFVGSQYHLEVGGQDFYMLAVDDRLSHPDDQPGIGPILCKERNRVVVEYALRGVEKPIGVAEYRLTEQLPEQLRGSLPSVEELERELGSAEGEGCVLEPRLQAQAANRGFGTFLQRGRCGGSSSSYNRSNRAGARLVKPAQQMTANGAF